MRLSPLFPLCLLVAACVPATLPPTEPGGEEGVARAPSAAAAAGQEAASTFLAVIRKVEPVAEQLCRKRGTAESCDFRIVIDDRPNQVPNAYQTVDAFGRPIIGFTLSLIAEARNADELAFVLGHEAGHHIAGHIPKQRSEMLSETLIAGVQARADGLSAEAVEAAQARAAVTVIRTYSQAFELEADAIGAEIAFLAGFDPVKGTGFFDRLPEPGNGFLSTHPAHSRRKAVVLATVRKLGGQGQE